MHGHSLEKMKERYGYLWTRDKHISPVDRWHYSAMKECIDESIVRGKLGIDVGSGCGYDTYIMANQHPLTKIVSIDISDGVFATKTITESFKNVQVIKCSFTELPLKDNIFDFAYSFGVLHHLEKPKAGLLEISRILKKDGPAFLYLYEDHSENRIKSMAVRIITLLRGVTIKIPSRILYVYCFLLAPLVYMIFYLPSRILSLFKYTQNLANKMPFNIAAGPFSLRGDLYDRFSAPIEHRFNKLDVDNLFNECNFYNVQITKLKKSAGWVAWGYKK